MGLILSSGGGAGGDGSDECNVTANYVVKGKTYIGADTNDEIGTGTLALSGNAGAHQVVNGKTFYTNNPHNKQTGTLPDYSRKKSKCQYAQWNKDGDGNLAIAVERGYYECSWADSSYEYIEGNTVRNTIGLTANKIMQGQAACGLNGTATSDANATASQILSGYSAYVKGVKINGNMTVQSILSFNCAVYSSTAITFTWKNPAKGAFSGVIIVGRTGSYPTGIGDGTRYYKGCGNNTSANGTSNVTLYSFASGTTYYFRAFSYVTRNNAEWIHGTTYTGAASTTRGLVSLTSSGTWTVPAGVRNIDVFCVGGGGGDRDSSGGSGKGGGGGYTRTIKGLAVSPGQQIGYIIGAGGSGAVNPFSAGAGGTTSFGSYISAEGGKGVSNTINSNGGSGGGDDSYGYGSWTNWSGGRGGSDGGDGGYSTNGYTGANAPGYSAGKGQGSTTRAFGESGGTLYSGGGGGGAAWIGYAGHSSGGESTNLRSKAGVGGAGGGGHGAGCNSDIGQAAYTPPSRGGANTGGGGGGGCFYTGKADCQLGASGGSGIILIRWGY